MSQPEQATTCSACFLAQASHVVAQPQQKCPPSCVCRQAGHDADKGLEHPLWGTREEAMVTTSKLLLMVAQGCRAGKGELDKEVSLLSRGMLSCALPVGMHDSLACCCAAGHAVRQKLHA